MKGFFYDMAMTLDLFAPEPQRNILPFDGDVEDFGLILSAQQAEQDLHYMLQHLAWQHDQAHLHGKHYITARQVAWYGDASFQYVYSGVARQAMPWDPVILKLKQQVEDLLGLSFNSCLANLYEDGTQAMGWHSDQDRSLGQHCTIASLSFGATRKFAFRHIHRHDKVEILLQSGQLIVMRGQTQQFWQHRITPTTKVITPRINLTFRQFLA